MKLDDVAKAAGVSKAAVSFALNNKPGIGKATRKRVLEIAAELGYAKSGSRSGGRQVERRIQFLAVNTESFPVEKNISNTFFAELIRNLESTCSKNNCLLVVSTINMDQLDSDIQAISMNGRALGTVLLGTNLNEGEMLRIARRFENLIVIDNAAETTNLNTVSINNYQGASSAARCFLDQGIDAIGYVMSSSRLENFDERYRGFFGKIKQGGLRAQDIELFCVEQSVQEAQASFIELLNVRKKPLPKALFCESDYIALGVMRAMIQKGYRIPEDVRVIGFDDVPEATIMQPELATVHVNKDILGRMVGKRIFEIIEDPTQIPLKVRVDTVFIHRQSAGFPDDQA